MASVIASLMRLTLGDLSRQKRRVTVAVAFYAIAGVLALIALIFGFAALGIWLAQTYGMIVAFVLIAAGSLSVSAVAIIANAIYQRRQKRKLAQSAAVKGAAAATALTLMKRRAGFAPLVLATVGYVLATQVVPKDDSA